MSVGKYITLKYQKKLMNLHKQIIDFIEIYNNELKTLLNFTLKCIVVSLCITISANSIISKFFFESNYIIKENYPKSVSINRSYISDKITGFTINK